MRGILLIGIIFISFFGFGQNLDITNAQPPQASLNRTELYLNLFLNTDLSTAYSAQEIEVFISKLEIKRKAFKHDEEFLHYIFFKTHQKFLKHYIEYCTFDALIKDGTYNCLTGTALYAVLLNHFNFDFKVIETNYHIFLITQTSKGEVLFEATDPLNGFVHSNSEIQNRIAIYKTNQFVKNGDEKTYYRYNFNLYNTVSMEQLLGLMYYNLAIEAYNKHDLSASITHLSQSAKFYQSVRIEDFSRVVLLTVAETDLTNNENEICLKKIQLLRKKMHGLTSAN